MSNEEYKNVFNKIQSMIENKTLTPEGINELEQFKKDYFYNNWLVRYRRIASFTPLGTRGVIAIPNTTFEEWLVWFEAMFDAFLKDYNEFKKLTLEALQLHEKHLQLHDEQIKELQRQVQDIYNKIDKINDRLNTIENKIETIEREINNIKDKNNDLQNQINNLRANMFSTTYTNTEQGTLKNNWYMKDDHDRAFGLWWGWNNPEDHSQGVHWIPLINYIYKDNANYQNDLSGDSLIGTIPQPPELIQAGKRIGETWMYSGYSLQSAPLVGSPYLHIVPVAGDNLEIRIINTTRSGNLPDNFGTVQLNAGGTPPQYIN